MTWSKPEAILINPPNKPTTWIWLVFFIVLFLLTALILIFYWPNNSYFNQVTFWLAVIFIPSIIGGITLSIRFYIYGLAWEHYDIWQQEQKKIDNNWQLWAMQSVNVLGSYLITPNQLTAENIPNIPVEVGNALNFGDDLDYPSYFQGLFSAIQNPLSALPATMPVNITVLSPTKVYEQLDNDIETVYRGLEIEQPYTISPHVVSETNIALLVESIENSNSTLQLIIIDNILSSGSAFFCAFLLINKAVYQELTMMETAKLQIFRPMITKDIVTSIEQMRVMQPVINDTKQLLFANMDKKQEAIVAQQLAEQKISPDNIYSLDNWVGKPTFLSYWLLLALGCEMVMQTKQHGLIVSIDNQNNLLFSVITTTDEA